MFICCMKYACCIRVPLGRKELAVLRGVLYVLSDLIWSSHVRYLRVLVQPVEYVCWYVPGRSSTPSCGRWTSGKLLGNPVLLKRRVQVTFLLNGSSRPSVVIQPIKGLLVYVSRNVAYTFWPAVYNSLPKLARLQPLLQVPVYVVVRRQVL